MIEDDSVSQQTAANDAFACFRLSCVPGTFFVGVDCLAPGFVVSVGFPAGAVGPRLRTTVIFVVFVVFTVHFLLKLFYA